MSSRKYECTVFFSPHWKQNACSDLGVLNNLLLTVCCHYGDPVSCETVQNL